MRRILLVVLALTSLISCKNENSENQKLQYENKLLQKELEIAKLKDSVNTIKNSAEVGDIMKVPVDDKIIPKKYDYIKKYKNKYPYEVKLFETGVLKERLLLLLGKKNYTKFIEYFDVQGGISIINDEYTFLNAGAAHSFGSYESAILIDYERDEITVGILDDKTVLLFSENKDFQKKSNNNGELQEWIYASEKSAALNKSY